MKKVLIYTRISTSNKNQNEERQIVELTNHANRMGHEIVNVICDRCSGSNDSRESLTQILEMDYDILYLSEISRLSRKTSTTLSIAEKLGKMNKSIFLLNYNLETIINGKPNPVANLIMMVLAEMAKFETETLRDRIVSSLNLCRAKGIKLGRKAGSIKAKEIFLSEQKAVVKLVRKGLSLRQIASIEGCSINTVRKVRYYLAA